MNSPDQGWRTATFYFILPYVNKVNVICIKFYGEYRIGSFSVWLCFTACLLYIYSNYFLSSIGERCFSSAHCSHCGSSLRVKITLIIIRLLAGFVVVLIEQISTTNMWTGGGSLPPSFPPSPLSLFPLAVLHLLSFPLSLFSQADGFDEHPLWTLSVSAGITNTGVGFLRCGRGGTMDTERRQRTVGLVGVL